jgi:sterol desaturase/sphingolipid hydroxylase (fatty acid hydroxylase superfamily)
MQIFTQILVFTAFFSLVIWTICNRSARTQIKTKSLEDWLLDSAGLFIQGIIIPLLQITFIYQLYHYLLPNQQGYIKLSPILAFILSFILVDYLYYWNHRLLHTRLLWQVHQIHHTVTQMDVLGTSRNTLWASLLIVYLWAHALFLYLLADSTGYLWGISLTSALDLWRHSRLIIPTDSLLYSYLSPWLVLPQDHAKHHSRRFHHCNYGANFNLWDRLHGTFSAGKDLPEEMGIITDLTFAKKLLFPFL